MTNPLFEVLPAKARKYAYALLSLAALGFSIYQASQGDWKLFVGSLLAALVGGTAASNTDTASYDGQAGDAGETF